MFTVINANPKAVSWAVWLSDTISPKFIKSLILVFSLCWSLSIYAQPVISLWKIDEAHHANPDEGESYFLECDSEYYIYYNGSGTYEDFIIGILNDGDEVLELDLPLSLSAASSSVYSIIHQPEKTSLVPDEETHFIIRYTAPSTYQDDKASIVIDNIGQTISSCSLSLDVGLPPGPTISKIFTPSTIGPGSVSTITFTITNPTSSPVTNLAFTDVLPIVPGLMTIATPSNATSTCGAIAILTAPDGGGIITFVDGAIGAGASCTVTVDVTASTAGVYTNPAITLSSSAGSSMSLAIDLTVATDRPGFSKSFAPSSIP
ncbi:MAG: DUF11 domain-containing protein, partial [Candidatus Marinimicrobia bacterium]|nr:DUF11 domain-containing protein [Candidatus Neomarinimicrobiota bacterium]